MDTKFLVQNTKTRHFTLGVPRNFALSVDGDKIFFLRSKAGDDPVNCLWLFDTKSNQEELLADPAALMGNSSKVTDAEKQLRERMRELADGIVSFSIDKAGSRAVFVLNGDLFVLEVGKRPQKIISDQAVFDPRLSPNGKKVAYIGDGALCVLDLQNKHHKVIANDPNTNINWGQADFIAAEEIGRMRGFWWSPDSLAIVATKVDSRQVKDVYLSDPAAPEAPPTKMKYPLAGTANSITSLTIFNIESGEQLGVNWDLSELPYLVGVNWQQDLIVTVQSRDQKKVEILQVDTKKGGVKTLQKITSQDWVELDAELPMQLADSRILHTVELKKRVLAINGQPITPDHLHFSSLCGLLKDGTIIFSATKDDPKTRLIMAVQSDGQLVQISQEAGLHSAIAQGQTCILRTSYLDCVNPKIQVLIFSNNKWQVAAQIKSCAWEPSISARPKFYKSAKRSIETALLLPQNYDGHSKLPVLLDPYGGPHAQMVVASQRAYLESQWFANQGFAVIVADGRGTPGRDIDWEKSVAGDLISFALQDQIEALQTVAAQNKMLDLNKVAMRGWSFGGYLAAFAVLRHPEVFHAAIAGAPVTDFRLYDTHYTERYLGDPFKNAKAYDNGSLVKQAYKLQRPLMLIHGLADDNVLFANSLQFSSALLAHGRPHQFLPLASTTHMPSQSQVAENLMALQLRFLRQYL